MKKYLRAVIRSFHDPAQYREALKKWDGFGGAYAAIIAAISTVLMVIVLGIAISTFKVALLPKILDNMPEIAVTKGEMALKLPKGYKGEGNFFEVVLPDGQKIVIDPNRQRSKFETDDKLFIGVGHNFMTIRTDRGGSRTTDFNSTDNFVINRASVEKAFGDYHIGYLAFVLPIIFVGQWMIYLISMVVTAVVSYAITALMREEYDFHARLRISALALTPGVVLSTLVMFLGHRTGPWFAPMVASLYIYVMIVLMRKAPAKSKR